MRLFNFKSFNELLNLVKKYIKFLYGFFKTKFLSLLKNSIYIYVYIVFFENLNEYLTISNGK